MSKRAKGNTIAGRTRLRANGAGGVETAAPKLISIPDTPDTPDSILHSEFRECKLRRKKIYPGRTTGLSVKNPRACSQHGPKLIDSSRAGQSVARVPSFRSRPRRCSLFARIPVGLAFALTCNNRQRTSRCSDSGDTFGSREEWPCMENFVSNILPSTISMFPMLFISGIIRYSIQTEH